jgi:hypothetical protein
LYFLQMLLVMTNKSRKIPHENTICKYLLQAVIYRECDARNVAIYPHNVHWRPLSLCFCMIFLLELENCYSVAQLVIALERHRGRRFDSCKSTDSLIFCNWFGFNYNIRFPVLLTVIIITILVLCIPSQEIPSPLYPESHVHV